MPSRKYARRDGVHPRGPGAWRIVVYAGVDPATGKKDLVRRGVRGTKKDARRALNVLRAEVQRGTVIRADDEIVERFLLRWIQHRETIGKVRPRTADVYRSYVRREVVPIIGAKRVSAVRPRDGQAVLDSMIARGLAPRTVVQVHRILHAAFKQAVRWQMIAVNPSDGVTPPKVEAADLIVPDAEDIATLLAKASPEIRPLIALDTATGMRRAELCASRWSRIELDGDAPYVRVDASLQRIRGRLVLVPTKTKRANRTIPLPPSAVAMLRRLRKEQAERRLLAGDAWPEGDWVFDRGDGRPMDPDHLSHEFKKAAKAAGLNGVRFHDLRHAFATMMMQSGVHARIVADILGHATTAFTADVYQHVDLKTARIVADTIEGALGNAING